MVKLYHGFSSIFFESNYNTRLLSMIIGLIFFTIDVNVNIMFWIFDWV